MSFDDLMNNSVKVLKPTRTRDDYAGWTTTYTTRFSSVPCRIQPMSGKEQSLYNSEREVITHKMFCPGKFKGITAQDQVWEGSIRYDVDLVRDIDKMGHHLEIEMREIREDI